MLRGAMLKITGGEYRSRRLSSPPDAEVSRPYAQRAREAVFNLLPIPPLDGSKMVYAGLRSPAAIAAYRYFAQFGIFVLIGFLYLFDGFYRIVWPVVARLYVLLGLPLPSF